MRISREKDKEDKTVVQTPKKLSSGKLDTYIGEQTSFEGTLTSKDNISIYGGVKGEIECQGRVVIGESGKIEADILANDVMVSGKVTGNVVAKNRLEISPSGILQGDIKTARMIMQDGSKFDGHCEMILETKPGIKEKAKVADVPQAFLSQEKPKLPSASQS